MAIKSKNTLPVEISIIIVNYNVRDFLFHCLTSVKKALKKIHGEIIVIDNASDDGSVSMIRKHFKDITLVPCEENLGFAKANNIGLSRSKGKFILLLNPDTLLREDTIRIMLDFFRRREDVGMASCKITNPDGSFQLACRRSFPSPWVSFCKIIGLSGLFPKSRIFGRYNMTYRDPDEECDIDALSGSFMMFRREVYETIGGLDTDFFMYGEDIDYCYRTQKSGWKIHYTPSTSIIHYKGESTKRSNINEIRTFYEAMHLFVEKHFSRSLFLKLMLRSAILLTTFIAYTSQFLRPLRIAIIDFALVDLGILLSQLIYLGSATKLPEYAYPTIYIVPALLIIASAYILGAYTYRRMSLLSISGGVAAGTILVAAFVAFFKQYAFSRGVIIYSGVLGLAFLLSWRFFYQSIFGSVTQKARGLFSHRVLIVGTEASSVELMGRLRKQANNYSILGFIDVSSGSLGKWIKDTPIVGSLESINKAIKDLRISDVVFPPGILSYSQMLTIVANSRENDTHFYIVPSTLEVIIGKSTVDSILGIPLFEISYNIEKLSNRFWKRAIDIIISSMLLITIAPFTLLHKLIIGETSSKFIVKLPSVLSGKYSLVGYPSSLNLLKLTNKMRSAGALLGKPGLTGLVQLRGYEQTSQSKIEKNAEITEIEQFVLIYAKNQSILLDLEILLHTFFQRKTVFRR